MRRRTRFLSLFAMSLLCGGLLSAHAETLRCQSVNGNVNCVGPSAASCQTVNGRTTCVSRNGDVVQSFGNHAGSGTDGTGPEDDVAPPDLHQQLDILGPGGRRMSVTRDGSALHFRSNSMMIDRD
jgi:hypothetical protein